MTQLHHAPAAVSRVAAPLQRFVAWLDGFGETSLDHQTFYAGRIGGAAKRLYYRRPRLGTAAVAPLVFCEAFLPSSRRLFYERVRFPIADAHYAMGFAFLHEANGDVRYKERAVHFLDELVASRSPGFEDYCWGYPFDWVTRNGTIAAQTPLVTTTPYVFEAFLQVHAANPRPEWAAVLESIARHIARDIKEIPVSSRASGCSYTPFDTGGGVVNAAAYRAFALTRASGALGRAEYREPAERNLNFVLESQNGDGSWYYAVDGVRDFVDHYHTCFVMKALAKIHALTGDDGCLRALERGVAYYREMLFDEEGLPKPFARAPRLTVYRRELYDYAECINLCVLLRDRFPVLGATLETVLDDVLRCWVKPDGSFRSRRLLLGWDDVPMHRWGQAQMFRSLAYYWRSNGAAPAPPPTALSDGVTTRRQETCVE
jgi:hypothetical protein